MQDPTDPDLMTPEERLAEIGRILGRGYLRYRAACRAGLAAGAVPPGQEACRSPENELDRPGDQSVHCPEGRS